MLGGRKEAEGMRKTLVTDPLFIGRTCLTLGSLKVIFREFKAVDHCDLNSLRRNSPVQCLFVRRCSRKARCARVRERPRRTTVPMVREAWSSAMGT